MFTKDQMIQSLRHQSVPASPQAVDPTGSPRQVIENRIGQLEQEMFRLMGRPNLDLASRDKLIGELQSQIRFLKRKLDDLPKQDPKRAQALAEQLRAPDPTLSYTTRHDQYEFDDAPFLSQGAVETRLLEDATVSDRPLLDPHSTPADSPEPTVLPEPVLDPVVSEPVMPEPVAEFAASPAVPQQTPLPTSVLTPVSPPAPVPAFVPVPMPAPALSLAPPTQVQANLPKQTATSAPTVVAEQTRVPERRPQLGQTAPTTPPPATPNIPESEAAVPTPTLVAESYKYAPAHLLRPARGEMLCYANAIGTGKGINGKLMELSPDAVVFHCKRHVDLGYLTPKKQQTPKEGEMLIQAQLLGIGFPVKMEMTGFFIGRVKANGSVVAITETEDNMVEIKVHFDKLMAAKVLRPLYR